MKLSTKQILIISAIVLVVFVIVGIWFYRKGTRQITIQEPPLDDPETDAGANNPYAVSKSEILQVVDGLYRDMQGFNWSGHDIEPFEKLQSLSDTDFVNVYNVFNSKYQQESQETLKEWIESESFAFDDIIDSILARMGRLNLI